MRKIASIHIDIAELTLEVFTVPEEKRGAWITEFVSCLANGEGSNNYAKKLIEEANGYREEKSQKARQSAMARWEKPQEEPKPPRTQIKHIEKPEGIPENLWDDFLNGRKWGFKKKGNKETPLTERAWKMIVAEAEKAKVTLEEALAFIAANQTQTFKADYCSKKIEKRALSSDGQGVLDTSHWQK